MRIIVTGSRDHSDAVLITRALNDAHQQGARSSVNLVVVHGGCTGADDLADKWATQRGIAVEVHPAEWAVYGKNAGPLRNQYMADLGAELCLAFPLPGSRGTWDMIRRAVDAGITTHIHPERA